ncbi:MAG: glycosyltransferase [Sphingobacteriales bacterium]|nr:glycosyltransferase [Sphingobacteriales bacterium]
MVLQIGIGFNLFFPLVLLIFSKLRKKNNSKTDEDISPDYAVIVTAYEETNHIPYVVQSILEQDYQKFIIYVVADKCDTRNLIFDDSRVVILRPDKTIGSNTGSHWYAVNHFKRNHTHLTIIDSDNIVHPHYLTSLNKYFNKGFKAVQGIRAAKNLNSTYACLDAARDIYYHFYDGEILFNAGSSSTLSGSGMAFTCNLYQKFLSENKVKGAGFDKVLQAYIINQNLRIAFNVEAIVYDEKTTNSDQLVKQRSRWINTWFKYFKFGFSILFKGMKNLSINQFIFGLVLLRPPLFIFLLLSVLCLIINLTLGFSVIFWILGFACFILGFFIALLLSETDKKIYQSLINIPKFIFFQILSLIKVRKANKISVATKHEHILKSEIIRDKH